MSIDLRPCDVLSGSKGTKVNNLEHPVGLNRVRMETATDSRITSGSTPISLPTL